MALVLAVLSLLPVLVGFLTAGDFPQFVFKPPLWLVRVVFGSRYLLIALSVVLYLSAIIVHLLVAPTSTAFLIVVGVLVLVLTYGAFFAEPTLLSVEYNFAMLTNKLFTHRLERGQRSQLKRHRSEIDLTRNFSKQ